MAVVWIESITDRTQADVNRVLELNAKIEDSLLGQKVVKAFTNEELENEKFEKGNQEFLINN